MVQLALRKRVSLCSETDNTHDITRASAVSVTSCLPNTFHIKDGSVQTVPCNSPTRQLSCKKVCSSHEEPPLPSSNNVSAHVSDHVDCSGPCDSPTSHLVCDEEHSSPEELSMPSRHADDDDAPIFHPTHLGDVCTQGTEGTDGIGDIPVPDDDVSRQLLIHILSDVQQKEVREASEPIVEMDRSRRTHGSILVPSEVCTEEFVSETSGDDNGDNNDDPPSPALSQNTSVSDPLSLSATLTEADPTECEDNDASYCPSTDESDSDDSLRSSICSRKCFLENETDRIGTPTDQEESSQRPGTSTASDEIHETQSTSSAPENVFQPGRKRARQGTAVKDTWKAAKNKKLRMEGKAYTGTKRDPTGKRQPTEKDCRKQGPACRSPFCTKSSYRRCQELKEEDRADIFKNSGQPWIGHNKRCMCHH